MNNSMLNLSDKRWSKLKHAYGNASDLPSLLGALKNNIDSNNYESEPFFSLWSRLCHQGDIYTASYAAVPHIVGVLSASPEKAHWDFYLLPTSIEIVRLNGDAPPIPDDLEFAYFEAINKLPKIALANIDGDWDELYCRVIAATIAAVKGQSNLAESILDLSPDR